MVILQRSPRCIYNNAVLTPCTSALTQNVDGAMVVWSNTLLYSDEKPEWSTTSPVGCWSVGMSNVRYATLTLSFEYGSTPSSAPRFRISTAMESVCLWAASNCREKHRNWRRLENSSHFSPYTRFAYAIESPVVCMIFEK